MPSDSLSCSTVSCAAPLSIYIYVRNIKFKLIIPVATTCDEPPSQSSLCFPDRSTARAPIFLIFLLLLAAAGSVMVNGLVDNGMKEAYIVNLCCMPQLLSLSLHPRQNDLHNHFHPKTLRREVRAESMWATSQQMRQRMVTRMNPRRNVLRAV